jgi:AcrR family transcriptional regulator
VPAILRAAGELLDEAGVDGLNTTAVARRAGVSTATLYRHFPDKHAVLRALVLDIHEERAAAVVGIYDEIATSADWRAPLARVVHIAYRMRLARPGGRSTRRALQTSPELWQWDQQQNEEIARALARALRRREPRLTRAASERIARVTVTASVALLDLACLDERRGEAILEDATALREAYLARYLD